MDKLSPGLGPTYSLTLMSPTYRPAMAQSAGNKTQTGVQAWGGGLPSLPAAEYGSESPPAEPLQSVVERVGSETSGAQCD